MAALAGQRSDVSRLNGRRAGGRLRRGDAGGAAVSRIGPDGLTGDGVTVGPPGIVGAVWPAGGPCECKATVTSEASQSAEPQMKSFRMMSRQQILGFPPRMPVPVWSD